MENIDFLVDKLDILRQRIRDSSLVSADSDWMVIDNKYRQINDTERIIRSIQNLHGRYKTELSLVEREVYGLYETIMARERLYIAQIVALQRRTKVS